MNRYLHEFQRSATGLLGALAFLFSTLAVQSLAAQNHSPPTPPVEISDMLERLQSGGYVLLIRHERTEVPSRSDDYSQASNECRAQRNLSLAGVAGAQETGFVLRTLGIDVGRVLTSPMCRSAETARYMFGVAFETDTRLMHHDPDGERNLDVAEGELRDLLKELAPGLPDTNIALVSHGGNILRASGMRISEGEIGVLKFGDDDSIEVIGHFMGSDLAPYARRSLQSR